MVLGFFKRGPQQPQSPASRRKPAPQPRGLAALLERGVKLQPEREAQLRKGMEDGLAFYNRCNESRLEQAFGAFDPEMRHALFELMFLLHVNDPQLSEITYTAYMKDNTAGIPRYLKFQRTRNFHMEGAPHGVRGLAALSPVFHKEFKAHIKKQFGRPVPVLPDAECPIVCLQSIGSIGTVGHKSGESDLDLQVVYDLNPRVPDVSDWDDDAFREALKADHAAWLEGYKAEHEISDDYLKILEIRQELSAQSARYLTGKYPRLYRYLIQEGNDYNEELKQARGPAMRLGLVSELMLVVESHARLAWAERTRRQEVLLIERVGRIQDYVREKYHRTEIYLFTCALDLYRAGQYTSSLEFKESSGSAYELMLNYETLMPGIQFTPTVPSHFAFPDIVNNDAGFYGRLETYIRFGALEIYREAAPMLVDMGHTPDLDETYVGQHRGAVYWEAFKAASGNLPKATLNLLRYEMLLDKRFLKTIVQMLKEPKAIDRFIAPRPESTQAMKEALEDQSGGVPGWVLLELEAGHPSLLHDPWWLRYKALKTGFGEEAGVPGLEPAERKQLSSCVDLAFALHIRISDVFTKPGDTRKLNSNRELVLKDFLAYAFPPGTEKRRYLEHIFAGEVRAVNRFESELRANFRMSLERTQQKIEAFDLGGLRRGSDEVKLWHHYYEENFEPKPNVVQRTIMNHLKVSRDRLRLGYKIGEGWFFTSIQRESGVGKRFDTFGVLNHLPEEVTVVEGSSFLAGLANCLINGYYGIINEGSLKESRTVLELDATQLTTGDQLDDAAAYVGRGHIDRMLERIMAFFPYGYHHYMDFLRQDRRIRKVFVFLNLWKFGRLSILYRDNLNTWYCDEYDHPELKQSAEALRKDHKAMVNAAPVHETLERFLRTHAVDVGEVDLATWVNPNSTETARPISDVAFKEDLLATAFNNAIVNLHPSKGG